MIMILVIAVLVIMIFGLSTQIVYLSTQLRDKNEQLEQIQTLIFKLTNNKSSNNESRISCNGKNDYKKLVNISEIKDDYIFILNYRDGYTESVVKHNLNMMEVENFKCNLIRYKDVTSVEIYKM